MSGARFASLSGSVARLERAIGHYFLDLANERGYREVSGEGGKEGRLKRRKVGAKEGWSEGTAACRPPL